MGPSSGRARVLTSGRRTSPYFAALVNGAASHLVEQDDLHNSSVLHPATVVFSAVLAAAQDLGKSGQELLLAAVAGYEAGIRIGEFLGRSHYRIFHTTATVGTLAAAVGVGKLMAFDREQFVNLLGSAGTQAAGLWEFLRDAADSKQLLQAVAHGQGRRRRPAGRLPHRRWPDRGAQHARRRAGIGGGHVPRCRTLFRSAIDVLGRVSTPTTVHQAKFSMGTVLGLIAVHGRAQLLEFRDLALSDPQVEAFRDKVRMQLDPEVDAAYPARWLGRVEVRGVDGRTFSAAIDQPKGDPGNTLSRAELEAKFQRLLAYAGQRSADEGRVLIERVWQLRDAQSLADLH